MQGERELCVPPSNERVVSQDTLGRALGEARRIRYKLCDERLFIVILI